MTENKKTRKSKAMEEKLEEETLQETPVAEVEEVKTVPLEEFNALKARLEASEARAAEYLDGWQRSLADFANYKKRVEQERSQMYQSAVAEIIKRYLPILDDLERALQNRSADPAGDNWMNGIELIYRKLKSILETEGVRRIPAEIEMFDPARHEAVSHEESAEHQSGQIIAVVQQGYMLGEWVIRPALVRVAK